MTDESPQHHDALAQRAEGSSRGVAHGVRGLTSRVSRPASPLVPPSDAGRVSVGSRETRAVGALVALAVAFNLWSLRAERLSVAYPNDSGLHLQMTTLAMDLLRHGLSPFDHWYPLLSMGSPFFVQYQSSSAIITGALSLLFGAPTTYAWSLYLLLSLWPVCVYWTTRLLGWGRWESAVAAAISPLLFAVTGRGFGHQSYIWIGSGLWSQLWAMWTLPLAWAFSWRFITQRKSLFAAVALLSLTIAFHFLSAYLAALTLFVWVLIRPSQLLPRTARALLLGVAALLSTTWVTVPLVVHAPWLAVNQFQVGTSIDNSFGARRVLGWLVSGQIYDWHRWPVITVFAAVGLVVCLWRGRHDERARALVGAWILSLLLFFGRPTLGPLLDVLPANQSLLLQRYIMGVQLAGLMMAGVGLVATGVALSRLAARRAPTVVVALRRIIAGRQTLLRTSLLIALVVAVLTPAWSQVSRYDQLSATLLSAQRGAGASQGSQVDSLVHVAHVDGGGRIYAGMPSNWGHYFYVGDVPVYIYLEQHDVDAVGFTLRTSSLMTDPEAYFDEDVPGDYTAFGIRYLLLPVDRRPAVHATLLRTAGSYRLWEVGDANSAALIEVVDTLGTISATSANLGTQTAAFLRSPETGRGVYPMIDFGGRGTPSPTLTSLATRHGLAGVVTRQSQNLLYGQSARASVVAHRRAVVLLKVSYDPGWTATVDGRRVPTVMIAPALVGVEVSRGTHQVLFTYHGYGDYPALVGVAVLTQFGVAVGPWWWRRRSRGSRDEWGSRSDRERRSATTRTQDDL